MKSTSRSRKTSAAASRPEPSAKATLGAEFEDLGLGALETRVQSAIGEIERLRRDNAELRSRVDAAAGSWAHEREELRQRVTHLVDRLEALARGEDHS